MEKKEKKSDLEQLLNSLIEKGWKPFGKPFKSVIDITHRGARYITSKESGLWQFVCENGMVEKGGLFWELGYSSGEIDLESRRRRQDYEYRLIESALCDEDKLEEFLLSNIKVEGEV